jgi:hypothetical protein
MGKGWRFFTPCADWEVISYPQIRTRPPGLYFARREICALGDSPMKRTAEILLTALALAGIYGAIPKSATQVGNPGIRAEQVVLVADGSDPMPLCRGKACK